MRDFITFSQVLNTVVGKLSDAASISGSVLARLKYLFDTALPNISADIKKYGRFTTVASGNYTNASPTNGVYYIVANVSGTGELYRASGYYEGGNVSLTLRITLDGNAYSINPSANNYSAGLGSKAATAAIGRDTIDFIGPIKFNTSLKVEVMATGTSNLHGHATWGIER